MKEVEWKDFNWSSLSRIPDEHGVYMLADEMKRILFIHHGKLRSTLKEHMIEGLFPIPEVEMFWSEIVESNSIAKYRVNALLENHYREFGRNPIFNKKRDDDDLRLV